jgi:hypothetical protein
VKFLLDHDVPDDLSFSLESLGHEVVKLREILPAAAPDESVLARASASGCVLVTCNRDDFLQSSAPEICVAIASSGSPMPKLREKALAFVNAGAIEAWILLAQSRQIEIYGRGGRQEATTFPVDTGKLFE